MGAVGLEPTNSEEEGFTVPCNCRYATPPEKKEKCWRKDLNPQPSDYKSGALPVELRQHSRNVENTNKLLLYAQAPLLFFFNFWRNFFFRRRLFKKQRGNPLHPCLGRDHLERSCFLLTFTTFFKFLSRTARTRIVS